MTGRSEEGVNLRITMVLRWLGLGLEVIIKNTLRAGGPPTPSKLLPSLGGGDSILYLLESSCLPFIKLLGLGKKTGCDWGKTL